VKAFLSVSGGIKGAPIKLKGSIICQDSFKRGCDINIAIYYGIRWAAS